MSHFRLHRGLPRREVDRTRVVDHDVDPAEALDGLGHRALDPVAVTDVADEGESFAAGLPYSSAAV